MEWLLWRTQILIQKSNTLYAEVDGGGPLRGLSLLDTESYLYGSQHFLILIRALETRLFA
ncbi:hypothetical protein ASG03_19125 [Rhizobium sp. Leaf341]|nr:hypothetical protein ASG03_19125 [Rhizobium sp. Leaf341]